MDDAFFYETMNIFREKCFIGSFAQRLQHVVARKCRYPSIANAACVLQSFFYCSVIPDFAARPQKDLRGGLVESKPLRYAAEDVPGPREAPPAETGTAAELRKNSLGTV